MALLILYGNSSPTSTRIYMLSLISLVLVCSFSYCSSSSVSSFGLSNVDTGNNVDNFDIDRNINNENNHRYRLPYRPLSSSEIDDLNGDEHPVLSKNYLLNLLLKSALIQEEDRPHRRFAPQSFHAMRG